MKIGDFFGVFYFTVVRQRTFFTSDDTGYIMYGAGLSDKVSPAILLNIMWRCLGMNDARISTKDEVLRIEKKEQMITMIKVLVICHGSKLLFGKNVGKSRAQGV